MKTPVLMVHGMSCTGEVWAQFKAFFEAQGVKVYAPTLRPEERVSVRERRPPRSLRELSLADYVDDLEREIDKIEAETGETPAVIGHSMGGLLVQALAERNRVVAAVSISPAASAGVHTRFSRVFWAAYTFARKRGWTPPVVRSGRRFLHRAVLNVLPLAERAAAEGAMVWESGKVFAEFASWPIDVTKIHVPLLTVAATRDRLVPAALVRLTGKKFAAAGGEFREYKGHGHWLYSEPGWETPAREILDWLREATARPSTRPPPRSATADRAGAQA
jgi:alpha-beta hydrolase superfamily lysophospholipase